MMCGLPTPEARMTTMASSRRGEEMAHKDAQPSDTQGKDNIEGIEQKGKEKAHNDARPYNAQGKDDVNGVKRKGEGMAHNGT